MKKVIYLIVLCIFSSNLQAQCDKMYTKWTTELVEFDLQDQKKSPVDQQIVLFVGSSTFTMWKNLPQSFPNYNIINRGFGGSHLSDLLCLYQRLVVNYRPQKVFLYEGDNDLSHLNYPIATFFNELDQFVMQFQTDFPQSQLYLVGVKPSPSRKSAWSRYLEANSYMKNVASKTPNVVYIDIWTPLLNADGSGKTQLYLSDQLHLNDDGYQVLVNSIKPYLK